MMQNSQPTAPPDVKNKTVPSYPYSFIPANPQPTGSLLNDLEKNPQNKKDVHLFKPWQVRGVTFHNRVMAAPMCQYSSDDGHFTDWHLVHLGALAVRGVSGIIVEATSVLPEGRITPEDAGLWKDSQIEPLKRITAFCQSQGSKIGVQLAHAGRKASTLAPWVRYNPPGGKKQGDDVAHPKAGGWPEDVMGPSAIPFNKTYAIPSEMTLDDIEVVKRAFVDATRRSREAGYDFIEIHGAHGYLLHNFASPLSNHRTDKYGGSLENRMRLGLEIAAEIRKAWEGPLFYRLSATDWYEGEEKVDGEWKYWGPEQTVVFCQKLKDIGIDMIDVSSGGNYDGQNKSIPIGPGYQVSFAEKVKREVPGVLVGAVGLITEPEQADDIIKNGQADLVLLAREFLRNADFVLKAAQTLGVSVQAPVQYERAWTRMLHPNH